ncbi:MAG: hypothetical protein ACFFDW_05805 [Candidatus Thorarchaeota archaeon]
MKRISTAVAYPTIPIIFLGGIKPNRTPIYDTMGLAVTSEDETTRTETTIEPLQEISDSNHDSRIEFFIGQERISGLRGEQIISAIKSFMEFSDMYSDIRVTSNNYNIFSGSSDSGLAALFTALNDFFECAYSKEELLQFSMKGSESAGRSLFGGLTYTKATSPIIVEQLASEEDLQNIKLFSVPFHYENRISADEIHANIVKNPAFNHRVNSIPIWVNKIKTALVMEDYISLLETAEENIRNAHELLENVGIYVRKPAMMQLCSDILKMREEGILCYYLIGGGNLITVATIQDYSREVEAVLKNKKWNYHYYKVASSPKII